jgi:DNA-binding transcriptional ArsR family regulator
MTYASALAALADPTRRAVFDRLRRGPRSVAEIASGLPVSRPAVSQHLRALKEARLVRFERQGTQNLYAVNPAGLAALRGYLDSFWDDVLAQFALAAEEMGGEDHAKGKQRRPRAAAQKRPRQGKR